MNINALSLKLKEALTQANSFEKKLSIIYSVVSSLMDYIFVQKDEKLPKDALYGCVLQIVDLLQTSNQAMQPLLHIMKNDYTTHHHSANVAFIATLIGKELRYSREQLIKLTYAALLHDIGKMRIDVAVLQKPATLTNDEFQLVKYHARDGYLILQANGIADHSILNGVLFHHEKLDGSGYPQQIHKADIPEFARIIGVCDVFDALTTKRTYRANFTSFEAIKIIKKDMAHQLDRQFSDLLMNLLH